MREGIVSPGVVTKEIDQTFLPAAIADIGAVVVGPTVKGPSLIPIQVSTFSEYEAKFGSTFVSGGEPPAKQDVYQYLTSHTAQEYLKNNSTLTVVRVMAGDYTHASVEVSSSTDPTIVGSGTAHSASIKLVGPLDIQTDGTSLPMTASFFNKEGVEVQFVFTGSTVINSDTFSATNTSTLLYVPSGSSLSQSADNFRDVINNSASLHGLPFSASSYPGAAAHATNAVDSQVTMSMNTEGYLGQSGSDFFHIGRQYHSNDWVSGSIPSMSVDNGRQNGDALVVEQFQGGFELNEGVPEVLFKLHTLSHGDVLNNRALGTGNHVTTNNLLISGSKNNFRWEISKVNKALGTFTLNLRAGNDSENKKQVIESFRNVSLDSNSPNFISKVIGDTYTLLKGAGTNEPYLQPSGSYPNKSPYVRVEVIKTTNDYIDDTGAIRVSAASASLPHFSGSAWSGSFAGTFSGASDGTVQHPVGDNTYENITTAVNTQGFNLNTGQDGYNAYLDALNLLKNQDEYDFNLLLLPGIIGSLHSGIVTKALNVCEERGDCFVLVDPVPYESSISQATTEVESRDSSYGAMYWPWVQITDPQTAKPKWVPPSVMVSGMYAFNDKVGFPWFAPAGLNRGTLDTVIQAERKLTHGDRDKLYSSNVNPIATFPGQGVTVWGQKTLQKKASALDRVNVRRLLIKLKKFFASTSRFLLFEQNNNATRKKFLNIVNPYMEKVQSDSGVSAFRIVMDDTNNTPDVVDRNILYGQIFIQPTRTAEFIVLDFTIQPTGATFPE